MNPSILFVRHSNTTWDHKVDATMNPPLDEQGVERLKRTVEFLDNCPYPFHRIVSSPLQRALKTAELISRGNKKVTATNWCLPWYLGDLMGKDTAKVQPIINYLEEYPDVRAPHGESYREFFNRWATFVEMLKQYVEAHPDDALLVTTHSRNINALQEIIGGNPVGDVADLTPEASVTLLTRNDDGDWTYKIIWEGK